MDPIELQESLWPEFQAMINRAVEAGYSRAETVEALLDLAVAEVCAGESKRAIEAAIKRVHGE